MKQLTNNVANTWGEKGQLWLTRLSELIAESAEQWNLSDITPVDNMNYNYVAKAMRHNDTPVVLKISCDESLYDNEFYALTHFAGHGSVKVLDKFDKLQALLLEQAVPGCSLTSDYTTDPEDTMRCYASVVNALATKPKPADQRPHVKEWCAAIDRITDHRVKRVYIEKAKEFRDFLLSSMQDEYLCHGDLHFDNIICHQNQWLSIDPKGIIGELTFEASAFILVDKNESPQTKSMRTKIIERVNLLATALQIDQDRLFAWIYLRVIFVTQWFIEDFGQPNDVIMEFASVIYTII